MKAALLFLIVSLCSLTNSGFCQTELEGCNEKTDASQTLFVFVGELLHAEAVSARGDYNEVRFSATYRIIERVCGKFSGDTITFDVFQVDYDSTFKKNKYKLLMLLADTGQHTNEAFHLWSDLCFDVFRTLDNQWAGSYTSKNDDRHSGKRSLKPKKIRFKKNTFISTTGMTKEEMDVSYPEPYYKINSDKAIPLMGNSIAEIFRHQKKYTLTYAGLYNDPDTASDNRQLIVQDVELENIEEEDSASYIYRIENELQLIADSLLQDPFNERKIISLIQNCRRREDYSRCSTYLSGLIPKYPDSVQSYLLTAKFRRRANLEDTSKIFLLKSALKLDSNNYEANYELADTYYSLFMQQQNSYYATTARKFFIRCISIEQAQIAVLKLPVIQLSHYLKDSITMSSYQQHHVRLVTNKQGIPVENKYNWYFPIEPFLRVNRKWNTDFTIDIMQYLRSAKFRNDWFSEIMTWFQEPVLPREAGEQVYRFLWLRPSEREIVIKMQKIKGSVLLSWKMPLLVDSATAADFPTEFKKKLSLSQWNKFEKLLTTIDFWSMTPGETLSSSTHESVWLLEAAINNNYHVTIRSNNSYPKYTNCLRYLIGLTDLNLPDDKFY